MQVAIKDKLYKDIVSYCELNELEIDTFINDLLKKSFMIEKYGEKPGISHEEQQHEPQIPSNEVKEVKKDEETVFDGGVVVEVMEEKKMEEPCVNEKDEKTEVYENFDYKDMKSNKSLNNDVLNEELQEEEVPVVVEKPKSKKRKLN